MDEHQSVMVAEVIQGLNIQPNGIYLDATFGRGGHSRAILEKLGSEGRLLAMDRDKTALPFASALAKNDQRFVFQSGPFSQMDDFCRAQNVMGAVDGLVLDLGVSSPQLDNSERGFSFQTSGPLDMRMDQSAGISAFDWIQSAEEADIAFVLKTYGEERFHRRIARAIVNARMQAPITTTKQLAEIIKKANPAWEKHKHPATRGFQAIRIFINNEVGELSLCLEQSLKILAQKGRLVVISFHSLEDRLVKHFIQTHEKGDSHPRGLPILHSELQQKLIRVGRRQKPSESETAQNVRARSAILRVAEKVGDA